MANIPITTFNGGEASPKIHDRVDTEKYPALCRRLENFIPTIYGGAERRPGTTYVTILEVPLSIGVSMTYEDENSISLLKSTIVSMGTAGTTSLYYVPTGRSCVVTKVVVRSPTVSLAGFESACFGSNSPDFNNWKTVTTEIASLVTVAADFIVLSANYVDPITMGYSDGEDVGFQEKSTIATANKNFSIKITTGSTEVASATIDVFGYLY